MISEATKSQGSYQAAFRDQQASGPGALPSWLQRLRERAMDHFEALGFPGVDNEEWKYTNVAPIARADFSPVVAGSSSAPVITDTDISAFTYQEARDNKLVFVNGLLSMDLSSPVEAHG